MQIVTLASLEVNLCLVITVLFQEIRTVKFGFRTSGDSILLYFLLFDAQTKCKQLCLYIFVNLCHH